MSDKERQDIYHDARSRYHTPEHMKTLLRRAMATGVPMGNLRGTCYVSTTDRLEHVHPLQGGIFPLEAPIRTQAWIITREPLVVLAALWVANVVKHSIRSARRTAVDVEKRSSPRVRWPSTIRIRRSDR